MQWFGDGNLAALRPCRAHCHACLLCISLGHRALGLGAAVYHGVSICPICHDLSVPIYFIHFNCTYIFVCARVLSHSQLSTETLGEHPTNIFMCGIRTRGTSGTGLCPTSMNACASFQAYNYFHIFQLSTVGIGMGCDEPQNRKCNLLKMVFDKAHMKSTVQRSVLGCHGCMCGSEQASTPLMRDPY